MPESTRTIEVTRTYLELNAPAELRPWRGATEGLRLEQARNCPASFFRYLYVEVGRQYHWIDRRGWTDADIRRHLAQAGVALWVLYEAGAPAGYFELHHAADGATEIAYFGLLPEYTGRGLGKYLLTRAVEQAWADGARRVWLHTCTLDAPAAMPNYLKRGFRPFKHETYSTQI